MLRAIAGGAAQPHHLHAACGNGGLQVPYTYRLFNPGTYPRLNPRLSYYSFDVRCASRPLQTPCVLAKQACQGAHACNQAFSARDLTGNLLTPQYTSCNPQLGNVHFLILDSETDSSDGSRQRAFAAADLQRVDRSKTPWIVVG